VTGRDDEGARLTTRLASRTAHDLNNVAAVFSGHVYLLRSEAEPLEEAFEAMEKALEHLERLTRGLASLGTLGIEPLETVDVNAVVRSAAEGAGGPVELDLDSEVPPLSGRREDLRRAVEALLVNAREANEPGRPVRLSTKRDKAGSAFTITIEDSGKGVEAEARRRDFSPLFSSKGMKGRGFGVTLARMVAALSDGSLALEDRPEGGTRAILRFPLPARTA
jgi:signal transduction histidine kinase